VIQAGLGKITPKIIRAKREGGGRNLYYTLMVGMKISAATIEISMEVPQKLKTELPYDHAGYNAEGM
jgi:hypothetical protein